MRGGDGVEVIRLTKSTQCPCGEPLDHGERAGYHLVEQAVLCLWCLADLQSGRPRPARRNPQAPTRPHSLGAAAGIGPAAEPRLASGRAARQRPSLPPPAHRRPPRRGRPSAGVSLLLALLIVGGALVARPLVFPSDGPIPSIGGPHSPSDIIGGVASLPPVTTGSDGTIPGTPPAADDAQSRPLGIPPAPRSASKDYRFMATKAGLGTPVTFDPCRPIHVVVNSAAAPPGADRLLREAMAEVSDATGLVFTLEGETTEQPTLPRQNMDQGRYGNRWSPVLVAWTDPSVIPRLGGTVVGLGGPVGAPYIETRDQYYASGTVYLDGPAFAEIITRPRVGWDQARAIVMHELTHLVGLTHVEATTELMHQGNSTKVHSFGPGDLEGLRQLNPGRCF